MPKRSRKREWAKRDSEPKSREKKNKIPTERQQWTKREKKTNDAEAKNKVYKTISIEMVLVENEIFPLRKCTISSICCWMDGCMYCCVFRVLFIVLYSLSAMSYWIGMFGAQFFFLGHFHLRRFFFTLALVVLLLLFVFGSVFFPFFPHALCHSSRFSFLLAIIFCTRPNGVFLIHSCFCLSL